MTAETQVLIAFILYLTFFGWIGARRGVWPELVLLGVTAISWVALQERGDILVRLTNFGGKFLVLVQSGGLSGSTEDAIRAVSDAPNIITDENANGFLFLVWAAIVLLTFIVTSDKRWSKYNKHKVLAVLLGAANGIVFAALLLPVLNQVLETSPETTTAQAPLQNVVSLVNALWNTAFQVIQNFWAWVQPISPTAWLVIITVLLLLIAWPMRGAASKKK